MLHGHSPLPWLLPGVVAALLVSVLLAGATARTLGIRRLVGWLFLFSLGVILAGTLTPLRDAFNGVRGTGTCDFSRMGLASWDELRGVSGTTDAGLNVLIFIPFGLAIGILPRSRWKSALIALAIALPFAIEATQLLLPVLDRACQSADVVDNLTGLVFGLAAGSLIGWLVPGLRRPAQRSGPPSDA